MTTQATDDDDTNALDGSLEKPVVPPVDNKAEEQAKPPVETPEQKDDKPQEKTEPPVEEEEDEIIWPDAGSDVGNNVINYLKDKGVTPEQAKAMLWDAAQAGDPTKIDVAALKEALGEAGANIVLAGMNTFIGEFNSAKEKAAEVIHGAVGGADNWNKLREWAKETLPTKELKEYVELIDKGGRFVGIAVKDLTDRYIAAGNSGFEPSETIPKQGKPASAQLEPLSRRAYYDELAKLQRTGKLTPEAQRTLYKRRMATK